MLRSNTAFTWMFMSMFSVSCRNAIPPTFIISRPGRFVSNGQRSEGGCYHESALASS